MSSSPLPYLCDGGGVGFRKTSKACNGQIDRLNNFEVTIIFQLSKYLLIEYLSLPYLFRFKSFQNCQNSVIQINA